MQADEFDHYLSEATECEKAERTERAYQLYETVRLRSASRSHGIEAAGGLVRILESGWSSNGGLRSVGSALFFLTLVGVGVWLLVLYQIKIPDPQFPGLRGSTVSMLGPLAIGEAIGVVMSSLLLWYLLSRFATALDKLDLISARTAWMQLHLLTHAKGEDVRLQS